jgi:hypothetical protein
VTSPGKPPGSRSAGLLDVCTKSFQANVKIVHQFGQNHFFLAPFQFIICQVIPPYACVVNSNIKINQQWSKFSSIVSSWYIYMYVGWPSINLEPQVVSVLLIVVWWYFLQSSIGNYTLGPSQDDWANEFSLWPQWSSLLSIQNSHETTNSAKTIML